MANISMQVNGKPVTVDSDLFPNLLRYLREGLSLLSVKNGCEKAQCGTCTVLINGEAKRSCTVKLEKLEGARIETLESLTQGEVLHPLQQAFIEEGAIQCGFCTPGMIMSARGLLNENLNPTDDDIRKALRFNLCRCTGYSSIIRAVKKAAAVMRGDDSFSGGDGDGKVGDSPLRKDALMKAKGEPIFADDFFFPDMLHGQIVYAEHPHAKILNIDSSEAEKAPGVVRVATHRDIPGQKVMGIIVEHQQILAEEEVIYVGDPVAVVYAETRQQAIEAARLVKVDYEVLPGVFDPMEARDSDRGFLHITKHDYHHREKMLSHTQVRRGDLDKGFAEADVILEDDFFVPFIEHAYLEPESGITRYDEDGVLVMYTSNQGSYLWHKMMAKMLALPEDRVRLISTPGGGGFGGKEEPTVQLHCALGTYLTGRPVKMTMTREESIMASTKRHAEWMHYKVGAKKDGTLVALEAEVLIDTGAYASLGMPVTFRSGVCTAGPYSIPNVKTDSTSYYTNNPPGGAFRGFGSTQVAFASEVMMDRLARELGMDPFELRLKNALAPGKQTITGQTLEEGEAYMETLEAVRNALEKEKGKYAPSGPGKKIGIGIAGSYKNVGLGTGIPDKAGAIVELSGGRVNLYHGAAEIGQGPGTVLSQILAEVAGVPFDLIDTIENDSRLCPDGEETTASRQTYISGNAVKLAAEEFRGILEGLMQEAGLTLPFTADLEGVAGENGKSISWLELEDLAVKNQVALSAEAHYAAPDTVPLPKNNTPAPGDDPAKYKIHAAYCYAAQAAIVEVDENTGAVKVLKIIAANDLGRAINPMMARGQVEGGVAMGVGYGVSEQFVLDQGRPVTDNLVKIGVPKITDMPEIEAILVESPVPTGPFGAKGMGELPVNPSAPAICNAIYDAVGVRINSLPATKDKVLAALQARK